MKHSLIIWICFLVLSSAQCLAQELAEKIENISLTVGNARRIPYHIVKIKITNKENIIKVNVSSKPKNEDKEWQYSKIDTTFIIDYKLSKILWINYQT
jgi:hypothetical protein